MVLQFCNTEKIQIFVDSGLADIITEYIMYIYDKNKYMIKIKNYIG